VALLGKDPLGMPARMLSKELPLRGAALAGVASLMLALMAPSRAQAELRFVQPDAEAGTVRTGTALAHVFEFTNTGPDTVEIVDLRASCGCLTPHLDKRVYRAGEHGAIHLEVNTLTQPAGLQSWRLEVSYRADGKDGQAALRLRARMVQEIVVQPAALVLVADRALGHTITVKDSRRQPLTVTAVRSSTPALSVAVRPSTGPGGQATIDVRMSPDFPAGRHEEIVSIYTNDPAYREMRVPVTIDRRPRERVLARPHEIDLMAPPDQPVPSRIVLLQDRDNQAVVVQDIHADDPAVTARWARGPGPMTTVRVSIDRQRVHGTALKTLLHIRVKQPLPQEIVLPVSCQLP